MISFTLNPKESNTTLMVVHLRVGYVLFGNNFVVKSYICKMSKNISFKNNGLNLCLKNRQNMETCQNKQKNFESAMLSAELSTVSVDRFFLVCNAILCTPSKNHINVEYD